MYIFGGMSVVSGLIALMLRETKGEMMADTVNQEEEKIFKLSINQDINAPLLPRNEL